MFGIFDRGNSEPNLELEVINFYKLLVGSIKNHTEFYLFTHLNPDLDSVCSNLAMAYLVKSINPSASINLMSENEFPSRFNNLEIGLPDGLVSLSSGIANRNYDGGLTIALDFNSPNRISAGVNAQNFRGVFDPQRLFCIDHHEKPEIDGFVYSDPSEASTCSMVYRFYKQLKLNMSREDKIKFFRLVLYGIMSDTNNFTRFMTDQGRQTIAEFVDEFNRLSSHEYQKALKIYESSEDAREKKFREVYIKNIIRYQGYEQVVGTYLDLEASEKIGKGYQKSINGADEITNIKGTYISFCVDELGENLFKISFRPCNGYDIDVSVLATEFGGGGHRHMSAARINREITLDQLCQEITLRCHNWLCDNYQLS